MTHSHVGKGSPATSLGMAHQGPEPEGTPGKRTLVDAIGAKVSAGSMAGPKAAPSGSGRPLDAAVRTSMETAFGVDFSAVQIHEGAHVTEVGARAYSEGSELHFAPGQYDPSSHDGQLLIAHELAHVVQRANDRAPADRHSSGNVVADPSLETEADVMATRAVRGEVLASGGIRSLPALDGGPRLPKLWVADVEKHPDAVAGEVGSVDDARILEILEGWARDEKEDGRRFASWPAAVRAARRKLPTLTIGFELEDSAVKYTDVDSHSARRHRAPTKDFDPDEKEMIVGGDSHPRGYGDLEIRTHPFDLGNLEQIESFFEAYKCVYADLFSIVGGIEKEPGSKERGFMIVPQMTVSIPIARLGDLVSASLFPTPDEAAAIDAFDRIAGGVNHQGLDATVDSIAKFLAFYLSSIWPLVLNAIDNPGGRLRQIQDNRAIISDKKVHSLFLKEVERDGVALNGVVDLYTQAREIFADHAVTFDQVVEELLIATVRNLGKADVVAFTQEYVAYLSTQAKKVKADGKAYTPEPFVPSATIAMKGHHERFKLLVPELEGLRDSTIEPNRGQEQSVFIEERRLNNQPRHGGPAEAIAKRLDIQASGKASYGTDKDPKRFAEDATERLRIMVDFYRELLAKELVEST